MIARLTEATGREARSGRGGALDALIDFYRAFNARNLDGLGTCITPDVKMDVRFRTPRWFTRRGDVWRQLHHHGSIEEPDCLQRIRRQSSERRWARRHEPRLPDQPVWLAGNCWLEASQPLPESLRVSFFSIPMV
jgi:hypothetical protein